MKRILPILFALLVAVSCEIPFEIRQEGEPKIYMQACMSELYVTVSYRIVTPVNHSSSLRLGGETIEATLNGNPMLVSGPYYWDDGKTSAYAILEGTDHSFFSPGDIVTVSLRSDGVDPVSASVEYLPEIKVASFDYEDIAVEDTVATEVRLTLAKAPTEEDFFGVMIEAEHTITYMSGENDIYTVNLTPGYILTAAESVSFDLEDFMQVNFNGRELGERGTYRPLTLVSKKQFDGATYKFYLNSFDTGILDGIRENMPDDNSGMAGGGIISGDVGSQFPGEGSEWNPDKIPIGHTTAYSIYFYQLSREAFLFAKALYQSNFDFLSNMGLTPANFTWSNVEGGLGYAGYVRLDFIGKIIAEQKLEVPNN